MTTDGQSKKILAKRTGARITMSMIAQLAKVSQVTVSRALSDPHLVSPETLARIKEVVEMTGFVPNKIAGALASRRSRLITALVPSITNIVYLAQIQTFSRTMRDCGYQMMLSETGFDPHDEETLIAMHLARQPDGMLLTGVHHTAGARRMLLQADIPVVEIWDITETPIDCCVGFSHPAAGQSVAEFAYAAGYRNAATVISADPRAVRRRDGFAKRFAELSGNPVAQINYQSGPASLRLGREALRCLLDRQSFRGVIFCSSDFFAHGITIEAQVRGLVIPDQVAVIGFGDQEFAADADPALTTVRVDRDELGRVAADALLGRVEGKQRENSVIDLSYKIVRRRSA